MSFPAARITDMTAHGGIIVGPGSPTVIIGGMPAVRLSDMHVCPMVTGVVPHVGGPILPPCAPTVLIGGMPAARVSDMLTCVGPPDVIIPPGCPTVLIGPGGAGGGGGGGATGLMTSVMSLLAAMMSAALAMTGDGTPRTGVRGEGPGGAGAGSEPTSTTQETHWIEYQFVDSADNPVSGIAYIFTSTDGSESEGVLGSSGIIRRDGIDPGTCTVKLVFVTNACWSKDEAEVGETVTLTADVEGYDPGTPALITIYEQNVNGADRLITTINTETQADKVEAEWGYEYPEDMDKEMRKGYSSPQYYFEVVVEQSKARSGLLEYKDYIEIEVKAEDGEPFADEEYVLRTCSGEIRKGNLDQNGFKKEENIPPGWNSVRFPGFPGIA